MPKRYVQAGFRFRCIHPGCADSTLHVLWTSLHWHSKLDIAHGPGRAVRLNTCKPEVSDMQQINRCHGIAPQGLQLLHSTPVEGFFLSSDHLSRGCSFLSKYNLKDGSVASLVALLVCWLLPCTCLPCRP